MADWPEFDALNRKRQEAERQRIALQKSKEEDERQKQAAFQEKVVLFRPRFIELLSYWDKIIADYLPRVAKGTWEEWQGSVSPSLYNHEPSDGNINLRVEDQLRGEESIIDWTVGHNNYYYTILVYVKDFKAIRLVVKGKNEHIAKGANEDELKKALLIAFQEGPEYISPPDNSWSVN